MEHEPACTGTRVCRVCGQELSVLTFAANHRGRDGILCLCRGCEYLRQKKYRPSRRATWKISEMDE